MSARAREREGGRVDFPAVAGGGVVTLAANVIYDLQFSNKWLSVGLHDTHPYTPFFFLCPCRAVYLFIYLEIHPLPYIMVTSFWLWVVVVVFWINCLLSGFSCVFPYTHTHTNGKMKNTNHLQNFCNTHTHTPTLVRQCLSLNVRIRSTNIELRLVSCIDSNNFNSVQCTVPKTGTTIERWWR